MDRFPEVIKVVFARWTALCLAIENGWGGARTQEKADDMYEEVLDLFNSAKANQKVHPDELEDIFNDYFENQFNLSAQDGSIEEVYYIF